jgi:hypothetical protein
MHDIAQKQIFFLTTRAGSGSGFGGELSGSGFGGELSRFGSATLLGSVFLFKAKQRFFVE